MTTHADEPTRDIPAALYDIRSRLIAARREVEDCARWVLQREAELTLMADGKNEAERKARATLLHTTDERAATLREGLRVAQEHVARLEVEEQYHRDVRRAHEWAIRERMADAGSGATWEEA